MRFALHRVERFEVEPGLLAFGRVPFPFLTMETAGPPRFLGNPCACAPCSPTPVGPSRQAYKARRCCRRSENHVGPREHFHFEAQSHGSHTPCVRFAAGVTPEPRNTRFRLVASLCRAGSSRRVPLQGFSSCLHMASPSPRLCLAHLPRKRVRVAYADPCHLVHAQGISEAPRRLLGVIPEVTLVPLEEADSCRGNAGLYSLAQPGLSARIAARKIEAIRASGAEMVASGNPGCLLQLRHGLAAAGLRVEVVHPVELVARLYVAG